MILNAKKYKLGNLELKKNELRFILLLSDNDYHKSNEIRKYLGIWTKASVSILKRNINKRAREELIVADKFGYKLIPNIEITY